MVSRNCSTSTPSGCHHTTGITGLLIVAHLPGQFVHHHQGYHWISSLHIIRGPCTPSSLWWPVRHATWMTREGEQVQVLIVHGSSSLPGAFQMVPPHAASTPRQLQAPVRHAIHASRPISTPITPQVAVTHVAKQLLRLSHHRHPLHALRTPRDERVERAGVRLHPHRPHLRHHLQEHLQGAVQLRVRG